jgi:hypothetical protein
MAQQPTNGDRLAQEKRGVARRARRLAQTQVLEGDRQRLMEFAAELESQAEAIERAMPGVSLPPMALPEGQHQQVQHQQVQQQQSADSSAQAGGAKAKE